LTTDAHVGSIRVVAIIDTGSQESIANPALRAALLHHRSRGKFVQAQITDTTDTVADGESTDVPTIRLGDIEIRGAHITFGDLKIFQSWNLADKPAILIGMDALGLVDTLVIDYRRGELQIQMRGVG